MNWIDNFLETQAAENFASVNTLAAYRTDLEDFAAWLDRAGYGFANATMIRVAHGVGRQQPSASRRAGYIGIAFFQQ